jgi:hypothetical protein
MQPVPDPDSWFIDWLGEQKLLNREIIVAYQKKLDEALRNHPILNPGRPTLAGLMERDGLLTKEQRESGEKEAARRRGEFMSWRVQAMEQQEQRRRPRPQ